MSRHPDRFTAVLDACVLAGALRRNMLLSLAEAGLFRPRWSIRILGEAQEAIARITKGKSEGAKQRKAIEIAFPEAIVSGFGAFEDKLELPDPNDNHVLAAAIATSVPVIVTDNLKHFPVDRLNPRAIEAISADDFIADTIELDPVEAVQSLKRMREHFNRPTLDASALIYKAEAQGLMQVANLLNRYKLIL